MTGASELIPILTAEEMRAWEARCFGELQVPERVVMESAGRAVAHAVARTFAEGPVVAAVGAGNNGGDAIVALRTLAGMGREVVAVRVGNAAIRPDLLHGWPLPQGSGDDFRRAGVVLDGILGTGANGAPRQPQAEAIRSMNASGRSIVAIDGPSGVDLTTGAVAGEAVAATLTITFGATKQGLLLYPGRSRAGRILVAEVGFSPLESAKAAAITDSWVRSLIPAIPPDAHKGSVGVVAIVAGSTGFGGAAIMTAMGALRSGSGGVRVVSTGSNRVAVHAGVPEAVFIDRDDPSWLDGIQRTRAAVVGPGLGVDDEAIAFLSELLNRYSAPLVLDADALTIIARRPEMLAADRARSCVLTPHPGELARLLDVDPREVLDDRIAAATAAAERFGCTVLSKGAPSLVSARGMPTLFNLSGHAGVATGGMGDTLGGVIGTFLALGLEPRSAAAAAIHLCGRAAEAAGRGRGLLPRDVAEALPLAISSAGSREPPGTPFLWELPEAY